MYLNCTFIKIFLLFDAFFVYIYCKTAQKRRYGTICDATSGSVESA